MIPITATDEWHCAHPGAIIGLLELAGIDNTQPCPALDAHKRTVEANLRARCQGFTRQDFLALPVMAAYEGYYRRFDKTYHILLQVESIVLKGKSLPNVSPLVDVSFMSEVETLLLTAGHDVEKLQSPVCIDISRPGDQITQLNGASKPIRAGDMVMRDAGGISCTILYGQDNRSPISPATRHVLYVTYAPPGVNPRHIEEQFSCIEASVRLFAPSLVVEQCRLLAA